MNANELLQVDSGSAGLSCIIMGLLLGAIFSLIVMTCLVMLEDKK